MRYGRYGNKNLRQYRNKFASPGREMSSIWLSTIPNKFSTRKVKIAFKHYIMIILKFRAQVIFNLLYKGNPTVFKILNLSIPEYMDLEQRNSFHFQKSPCNFRILQFFSRHTLVGCNAYHNVPALELSFELIHNCTTWFQDLQEFGKTSANRAKSCLNEMNYSFHCF